MDLKKSNERFEMQDVEANKVAAVLSYIGILVVVTLIIAPNSKFARYHANQGVGLLIGEVVLGIVSAIVVGILGFIPLIGVLIAWVFRVIELVFVILSIVGIVKAAKGEANSLPIVGEIHLIK